MKRTAIAFSMLVLLLSLALVSCDQMFSNNLFAGITQKQLTPTSVASMTPAEIVALTSSTDSMGQLAADPTTKQAALDVLAPAYATPAEQATAAGQAAAIAASDISIGTVPDAAQFASSAISLFSALSSSTSASSFADSMTSILPADISSQLTSSSTPPAAFTAMIDAFSSANSSYTALAAGVASTTPPTYADPSVTSSQMTEIAVDATISSLICSVTPTSGPATSAGIAAALWSALQNPSSASSYLSIGSVGTITSASGTLGGLYAAAGLAAR